MVSELGGGQPPSPAASLPSDAAIDHPVGAVTFAAVPPPPASPPPPPPPLEDPQQQQQHGQQQQQQQPEERQPTPDLEAMAVDGDEALPRSNTPALDAGSAHGPAAAAAALRPAEQHRASPFVPISELGGGVPAPPTAPPSLQPPHTQPSAGGGSSEDEEPSSAPANRPASPAGYESGDDMDVLNMQHCTNCTGALWGHVCMDCGHMPAHDGDIFSPTVASASALHRPRLQGDALAVLCWDERMELHEEAGDSVHPERPDRVRAVMARLRAAGLAARCRRLPAREATPAEVGACHIPELVEAVDALSEQSRLAGGAGLHFSPDTYVNAHTALCAKLSAGACVDVAAAVARGEARAGVAVVRPPGHHAESNTAMGFCFFNNAGIAARAAQAAGARRVLIVDWDVHHGNGTQHIFEDDPTVLYASLHRHDGGAFYPGTGGAGEVGRGPGEGATVNVPWPCGGMRDADYLAAFHHVLLPIAYEFAPDLIVISAGFDAAEGDPIGGCHVSPACYAHLAAQLQLVAPTVALLEGGYNLLATAAGTEAVLRVLLGERPPALPEPGRPPCGFAMAALAGVMRVQARYWHCLRGLVAQQFRAAAAAAERQQRLAALAPGRPRLLPLGLGSDDEEGGEPGDGEAEGGLRAHRLHRALGLGGEGAEEAEDADTPNHEYRGGSGWESDADAASDEQLSQGGSDSEVREAAGGGPRPEGPAQLQRHGPGGYAADASPLSTAAADGGAASDTAPNSDSEGPASGDASDGVCRPAGLTAGGLSPAEPLAAATPASRPSLAAVPDPPAAAAGQTGGERDGEAARWRSLALRPIVLKRPGAPPHQRLSPALFQQGAEALLRSVEAAAEAEAAPGGERAVPQRAPQP